MTRNRKLIRDWRKRAKVREELAGLHKEISRLHPELRITNSSTLAAIFLLIEAQIYQECAQMLEKNK